MTTGAQIERLIEKEEWAAARRAIRSELKFQPEDHWLLSRLALTYYEQRRYRYAFRYELQALSYEPNCPLSLWGLAGTCQALKKHKEALKIYQNIIDLGVPKLSKRPCGEGKGRARGLVADCYYRMSKSFDALGKKKQSNQAFTTHLNMRGPGCYSIYKLEELN